MTDSWAAFQLQGNGPALLVLQWSEPRCKLLHSEVEDNQFALSQGKMVVAQECVQLT